MDNPNMNGQPYEPMRRGDIDSEVMQTVRAFVEEQPTLPVHVHKLLKIVSDIESETQDIAKLAASDPAMVSKILKAVNSTYYGLSKPTSNLHLAIVLLGFDEVRKIALEAGLSGMFAETWSYKGYDTTGLWKHSFMTSVCAEEIAREIDPKRAGELLTMGILHDIGKYSLFKLTILIQQKGIAPFSRKSGDEFHYLMEKEEALFMINHPLVGALLVEQWDLPENLAKVVEYHHHPSFWEPDTIPMEYRSDAAIISIADALVNTVIETKEEVLHPRPEYFEMLGFEPSLDAVLTDTLRNKIEKAEQFITCIRD